jgi:hypothetical protein
MVNLPLPRSRWVPHPNCQGASSAKTASVQPVHRTLRRVVSQPRLRVLGSTLGTLLSTRRVSLRMLEMASFDAPDMSDSVNRNWQKPRVGLGRQRRPSPARDGSRCCGSTAHLNHGSTKPGGPVSSSYWLDFATFDGGATVPDFMHSAPRRRLWPFSGWLAPPRRRTCSTTSPSPDTAPVTTPRGGAPGGLARRQSVGPPWQHRPA